MTTKITCVYDEGSQPGTSLIGAKGTAMLVEKDGKRILFNTGLRDRYLIHNMEHLEIDPVSIDMVVVSQSNPCDSAALNGLLKHREAPIDVYCPLGLYGKRSFISRGVGVDDSNADKAVYHGLEPWQELIPGVFITPFYYDAKGYGETFLAIKDGIKVAILSGRCSGYPDKVISDVTERLGKPTAFIGPIFLEKKKKPVVKEYADMIAGIPDLYINHCVGRDGMVNLRVNLGLAGVKDFYVGDSYSLN
jgi:7,8-dihydropterin-6-yl-methyl-4-(beta-D-ribofuranosyl)aminobenzene 5'-phosphate synthase